MKIVLDMDDTLIANPKVATSLKVHDISTKFMEDHIVLRPFVESFLSFCNENFEETILCTFSGKKRMRDCLIHTGIGFYFSRTFSYEDIAEYGCSELTNLKHKTEDIGDFLLVDDMSYDSNVVLAKMKFFGVDLRDVDWIRLLENELNETDLDEVNKRLIQVNRFMGNEDDDQLIKTREEIMKRIS